MTRYMRGGFTVIETMLVIAVGGLLTAGVLAGSGVAIERQRYKESVTSVQTFIQDGYNLTVVSQNPRDGQWLCDAANFGEGGTDHVGQSDCMLVGRYITIDKSGTMATRAVVAYENDSVDTNSRTMKDAYTFHVAGDELADNDQLVAYKNIPWSRNIVNPAKDKEDAEVSILIIRSPLSNNILTYATDYLVAPSSINSDDDDALIREANREDKFTLCVETDSWFAGRMLGVQLDSFATGPGSVKIPDDEEDVCRG